MQNTREIVIVENIRLVRLLDFTADLGVQTNEKLTPGYTETMTSIFARFNS